MSVLEEFKAIYDAHIAELDAANKKAYAAVSELEHLSEKYGIPYRASVSRLGQTYQPSTYEKYQTAYQAERDAAPDGEELFEDDLLCQLTGNYPGDWAGWQHSAVC